uniref:WAP domain-containing protein n=1 Tax=Gouania willdenowi TaxID=441366 RepID=A0A8C5DCZ7_GOUWI
FPIAQQTINDLFSYLIQDLKLIVTGQGKPGLCPRSNQSRARHHKHCKDQCHSDNDCHGKKKCCFKGCGKRCLNPVKSKMKQR